jgi:hypothetical protein
MTDITIKNAKSCVVQLLVTEAVSIGLFGRSAHFMYMAVVMPVALFFFPVFAFEDRDYSAFLVCLLVDLVFLSLMAFLVVRSQRLLARAALFIFNVTGVVLVLGSY